MHSQLEAQLDQVRLTNIVQNCDYLLNSLKYSNNPAIDYLLTKTDFSPCVQATGLKASLVRWARGESLVFVKSFTSFSSIKMKPCGDHWWAWSGKTFNDRIREAPYKIFILIRGNLQPLWQYPCRRGSSITNTIQARRETSSKKGERGLRIWCWLL